MPPRTQVVSCVGAPESATFDTTAPRRIDGDGSVALVEAAAAAGVQQFVLVTSLGTGKFGMPAAVLNLFWGVLNEKRKAEQVCVCVERCDCVAWRDVIVVVAAAQG
jgi:hypothetical protein